MKLVDILTELNLNEGADEILIKNRQSGNYYYIKKNHLDRQVHEPITDPETVKKLKKSGKIQNQSKEKPSPQTNIFPDKKKPSKNTIEAGKATVQKRC